MYLNLTKAGAALSVRMNGSNMGGLMKKLLLSLERETKIHIVCSFKKKLYKIKARRRLFQQSF